jgi:hypothetical protein
VVEPFISVLYLIALTAAGMALAMKPFKKQLLP